MKTGDTVRFKEDRFPDEVGAEYTVIELNGDRAVIRFICDLRIPPQSVAKVHDLELIPDADPKS